MRLARARALRFEKDDDDDDKEEMIIAQRN
jgi:hypothetical protein